MPRHGILPRSRSSRSYQNNTKSPSTDLPSPRFPIEILDRIIELVIACNSLTSHAFGSIASFTLASSTLRQIALRRYFHTISSDSRKHWAGTYRLLSAQDEALGRSRAYIWVRSLYAPSDVLSDNPERLVSLIRLETLGIDFAREGLSTQQTRANLLLKHLDTNKTPINITTLTVSKLPKIDVSLLRLIAAALPGLINLHLNCTERLEMGCCLICFEDSLSCTLHSPIPDTYISVKDLALAFANSLKSLKNLTDLHLGMYLSDEQLLYSHIAHPVSPSASNESLGCRICLEAFNVVRSRELEASLIIAQRLKALQTIGWSSFFGSISKICIKPRDCGKQSNDGGEHSEAEESHKSIGTDQCMRTEVRIQRINGRIKVGRMRPCY